MEIQDCETSSMNIITHPFDSYGLFRNKVNDRIVELLNRAASDHTFDKQYRIIYGLLGYQGWDTSNPIDIFESMHKEKLLLLQTDPATFFLFDAACEGYSPLARPHPFFDNLYYSCYKHGISPRKIIYLSSNLKDRDNIIAYNKLKRPGHHSSNTINVYSFPFFSHYTKFQYYHEMNKYISLEHEHMYEMHSEQTRQSYSEKYVISLSRLNRNWRTFVQYLLSTDPYIKNHGIFSHDISTDFHNKQILDLIRDRDKPYGIFNEEHFKNWATNSLPLIADTTDFTINHAENSNTHIFDMVLFQAVNETWVDDWNGTSLFYSEKTFKNMVNLCPFIIYGQPHCNSYLKNLGYELYTDWFDYSFDSIEDPYKRTLEYVKEIRRVVNYLKTLTPDQHIEWKYQNKEVLSNNFKKVMQSDNDAELFQEIINDIITISGQS